MASTYAPIADINENDQGPINTVATIILIVTSVLFSSIRYVIGQRRLVELDADDAAFAVALVLAIITSITSQRMVPVGLGQHQDSLSADNLSQFFKVQYATHFLVILSMTASKISVVLFYRRIVDGTTQAPWTMKFLLPSVGVYAVTAIFLVAFQCNPPQPWLLEPTSCSSGGRVHYGAIALNILTDAILAVWIVPIIWSLKTTRGRKTAIIALVMSRLLVCIADGGRIAFVQKTFKSDDVTWFSLGWAIMDQVIIHLSLNHATLPRVHHFLGSLQTGLLVPRLIAGDNVKLSSYGSGLKYGSGKTEDGIQSGSKTGRSGFFRSMKQNGPRQSVSMHAEAHDSKTQLRLQPDHGNEMSTFVTAGDTESTSSAGNMKENDKGGVFESWAGVNEIEVISSIPPQTTQGIMMQQTVEIRESRV